MSDFKPGDRVVIQITMASWNGCTPTMKEYIGKAVTVREVFPKDATCEILEDVTSSGGYRWSMWCMEKEPPPPNEEPQELNIMNAL